LAAAVVLAAALVDLGALHRYEWGDSIVPVLVSLQRWTLFYWDQERFGMLVPLLALPVRDPLWNLLLQRFLGAAAGLGAVVLLARHVSAGRAAPTPGPNPRDEAVCTWPLAGALAVAGLLAAAPGAWRFEYLFDQPYGPSLALAAAGLAVAEPGPGGRRPWPRVAAGALLVLAAHWVNAATGVVLLALAAARAAADHLEREPARAVRDRLLWDAGLLVVGLAAGQVLLRLAPLPAAVPFQLHATPLPLGELPRAWRALLEGVWRDAGAWPAVLGGAAAAGLALLALPPLRGHLPGALVRAGALLAAALAYALFAGSLRWVAENGFHWRYVVPSAVLVQLAAASLLAEPLARLRRAARPAALAAAALVPAAALAVSGPPSLARVAGDLDAVAGRLTPDLLAARCDVVAGSYWTVWTAVWHAGWKLRQRGEARTVYGLSHRATPTMARWRGRPGVRICRAAGEARFADRWLRDLGLPPMRAALRVGAVEVLEPDSAPVAAAAEVPGEPPPRWWWGTRRAPPDAPGDPDLR
jgi:hypothetical protein